MRKAQISAFKILLNDFIYTEEDKIWLDGPNVMGLTNPVPWANEELAQHSLKPIVGRYSKSPGCRVLTAYG